mmetsp:Transcript_26576/g.70903  ORF Transcript_26576/g.70903 Transcript_26576/m.70903 type:complete len:121 (+) Transcript_26576:2-364(+)
MGGGGMVGGGGGGGGAEGGKMLYDAEQRKWVHPSGEAAVYDPVLRAQQGAVPVPQRFAPVGQRVQNPLWGTTNDRVYGPGAAAPLPPSLGALAPVQEKARIDHGFTRQFAPPRANTGFAI